MSEITPPPAGTETETRYDGRPLLRLLELYVLDAINEVPDREGETLAGLAPKLQALYGGDGSWQGAIAAAVGASPELRSQIRDLWSRNCEIACTQSMKLEAEAFARIIVDENFADY